jgi:hypothetical protein
MRLNSFSMSATASKAGCLSNIGTSRKHRRAQDDGNASLLVVPVEPARIEEISQHRANAGDGGRSCGEEGLKGFVCGVLCKAMCFMVGRCDCAAFLFRHYFVRQVAEVAERDF